MESEFDGTYSCLKPFLRVLRGNPRVAVKIYPNGIKDPYMNDESKWRKFMWSQQSFAYRMGRFYNLALRFKEEGKDVKAERYMDRYLMYKKFNEKRKQRIREIKAKKARYYQNLGLRVMEKEGKFHKKDGGYTGMIEEELFLDLDQSQQ